MCKEKQKSLLASGTIITRTILFKIPRLMGKINDAQIKFKCDSATPEFFVAVHVRYMTKMTVLASLNTVDAKMLLMRLRVSQYGSSNISIVTCLCVYPPTVIGICKLHKTVSYTFPPTDNSAVPIQARTWPFTFTSLLHLNTFLFLSHFLHRITLSHFRCYLFTRV